MSSEQTTCKNCDQAFENDFAFCPNCGQKAKDELTLGVLFYNTISNYFSFDARFFKSFIPLLLKPGYIARKFIEGKRLLYLHPAQMYLFVAVVFFFLFSFKTGEQANKMNRGIADAFAEKVITDSLSVEELEAYMIKDSLAREEARSSLKKSSLFTGMTESQIDSLVEDKNFNPKKVDISLAGLEVDSLIRINAPDKEILAAMGLEADAGAFTRRLYGQALKFLKSKQGGSILQTFYDTVPVAMFIVLPLFALLLNLFYRKSGRYTHHLVFSFYFFAFIFVVFSLMAGINFIVNVPGWIYTLIMFSIFLYLVIALRRFYQQGWLKSFLKGGFATILFFPLLLIVALGVGFFAFMFY